VRRLFGRAPDYRELHRLLAAAGANVEHTTGILAEVMRRWPDEGGDRHELVECEHRGDRITHDIIHHLYARSATPLDRDDVLSLASRLDDVVDLTEEVGDFLALYRVEAPMEQAIQLAEVLHASGREVGAALHELDDRASLRKRVVEIARLEDDGDRIEREALTALFGGGVDPMVVIRWKDIFERLESAIDACDHVGHVLEGIVVKTA
jgi:predicted phosphate transport protein (TIGR00153 family)